MAIRKTGNQKRKYACNRYEDIQKQMYKVLDKFGDDENVQILIYWINKLQKERATFRKKAVKYDELQSILEEYNVTSEILREVLLTGQMFRNKPTLLECIKEWNEKGFDVDVYALEIVIYNYSTVDKEEDEIEISIRIDLKTISYTNDVELSFDLHRLLSKTLKALEEKEND